MDTIGLFAMAKLERQFKIEEALQGMIVDVDGMFISFCPEEGW